MEALLKNTVKFGSNLQVSNKTFGHTHSVNVSDPSASVRQNFPLLVFKFSVSSASQRLFSSLKVILTFHLSHSRKGVSHHLSISELPRASFSSAKKKKSQPILSQSAQKENICLRETSGSQTKEILGAQRTVLSLDKHNP